MGCISSKRTAPTAPTSTTSPATFAIPLGLLNDFHHQYILSQEQFKVMRNGSMDEVLAERLTTAEVVEYVIKPLAAEKACRFVDLRALSIWENASGARRQLWADRDDTPAFFFVSHAFNNEFELLVDTLNTYFVGQNQEEVYLWLDIFAINQFTPELDLHSGGAMLTETVQRSARTLVILDKSGVPLSRLWCLYEMCETMAIDPERLVLLTHKIDLLSLGYLFTKVDVASASTSKIGDKEMILRMVNRRLGSVDSLTTSIRLLLGERIVRNMQKLHTETLGAAEEGPKPPSPFKEAAPCSPAMWN